MMTVEKKPCEMCGNKDWSMLTFMSVPGKGMMEACDQCDPANWIEPQPDYICPYNNIDCMFSMRHGHRPMCSCWGGGLEVVWYNKEYNHYHDDMKTRTAFCQPNWPLIEHLIESREPKDRNRIMSILMSEKQLRTLFVMPERVTDRYQVKIIRMNPNKGEEK